MVDTYLVGGGRVFFRMTSRLYFRITTIWICIIDLAGIFLYGTECANCFNSRSIRVKVIGDFVLGVTAAVQSESI